MSTLSNLIEIDSLEAIVLIDNELDALSTTPLDTVINAGRLPNIAMASPATIKNRGGCTKEFRMEDICCGAHGLSILLACPGWLWKLEKS
jgi:7,8-dihydropterin-6-yl-methyl-4-(beta-D-ribofuranosyl)aminobenzene 5'-phosphate synthase